MAWNKPIIKKTSDSDQGMSSAKDRNFSQIEKYRAILIKKNHSEHLVPITMRKTHNITIVHLSVIKLYLIKSMLSINLNFSDDTIFKTTFVCGYETIPLTWMFAPILTQELSTFIQLILLSTFIYILTFSLKTVNLLTAYVWERKLKGIGDLLPVISLNVLLINMVN